MAVALWNVEWLVKRNGGVRSVPAFDFLLDQPPAVRIQLLAIVDAVRTTGRDRLERRTTPARLNRHIGPVSPLNTRTPWLPDFGSYLAFSRKLARDELVHARGVGLNTLRYLAFLPRAVIARITRDDDAYAVRSSDLAQLPDPILQDGKLVVWNMK